MTDREANKRYRRVRVGARVVLEHRLVWEKAYGAIPFGFEIDHVNGDRSDNRLENLDLVTRSENQRRAFRRGTATTPTTRYRARAA